jgi:uncharacterized protein (DUF305 family)
MSPDLESIRRILAYHERELQLVELVPQRAESDIVQDHGRRSRELHDPQIRALRLWIQRRSGSSTSTTGPSRTGSPGAASSAELAELSHATGASFDRLFLALMTRHHEHVLRVLEREPASAAAVPTEILVDIQAGVRTELEQFRLTLARSPE